MILWVALLICHCLGLHGAAALEKIESCSTRCSQGLHCRTRPDNWFHPRCQDPADGLNTSSVFNDVSLSTVMRCKGRQKCSLHLRVKTELQLTESIHAVSICIATTGMMANCQKFSFTRASREKMSGLQVAVENDCTEILPSQKVQVIVKTVPSYCGVTWTGTYEAPDCISGDLQRHVPECITGRLSYNVNTQRKELNVVVSEMLEDHNYHLRLCRKDFICTSMGANVLIKKEQPIKSATLPYSRPLPCLCIEGWSAVMDAPRVQVCPFKGRLEELWFGITYDPLEGALSWDPACPVAAVVVLCQKREYGVCVDLPNASQNSSRDKITFTKVDPHPQLCMKFVVGSQSWTKCPFADAQLQAWRVVVTTTQGHEGATLLSQITATFSVGLCVKSEGSTVCQTNKAHTIPVERDSAVDLNLTGELCNSCLQVKRLDVTFAATVMHCFEQCNHLPLVRPVISSRASWDLTWVVVPAGVCLSAIIIVSVALHVLLTVYKRRKQSRDGGCSSEKQTSSVFVVPEFQTQPVLHRGVLIPDSPQCGNTEKANLISH